MTVNPSSDRFSPGLLVGGWGGIYNLIVYERRWADEGYKKNSYHQGNR
jgi:hypothetical protein